MTQVALPAARAPLIGVGGLTDRPFYRWFESIDRAVREGTGSSEDLAADIKAIAEKLGSPDGSIDGIPAQGSSASVIGNASVDVSGSLASGVVNIQLINDTQFPAATSYYGSDAAGDRGWFPVSAALADSDTIDVTTVAETGISSFMLIGFGDLTTSDLAEGSNLYFTKGRVASMLIEGTGIVLTTDVSGNVTISIKPSSDGNLLTDWGLEQLTDWGGDELTDWAVAQVQWADIGGKPTTLSGYGITDAVPASRTITAGTGLTGGGNLSANRTLALANTAVSAGTYGSASKTVTFTVDAQGRLIASSEQDASIAWTQISSGKPTTLAGYGITDALKAGDPVRMPEYTQSALPSAATYKGCSVICTDLSEGYRPVWSDGTNWRRFTDNTVAN